MDKLALVPGKGGCSSRVVQHKREELHDDGRTWFLLVHDCRPFGWNE